ncbi:MAG: hypothetical protein WAK83_22050 [Trebonia sp.]|uniref:hypothetical protein n=1 Tax=Trebonia sp. TaxID=2767075 RepID=UPI003BB1BC73
MPPLVRRCPAGRAGDIKREFFSGEPRLVSTEVVLPDLHNSPLVGTRTNEEDS